VNRPARRLFVCSILVILAVGSPSAVRARTRQAAVNPSGSWTGAVTVGGQTLPISVTFTGAADAMSGSIDVPGVNGRPLRDVRRDGVKMHFAFAAGLGLAIFDGTIDGARMSGTFQQGPAAGTFTLTRAGDSPASVAAAPAPYREEDVTFSSGAVTLAGTLTIPEGTGPFPAVMLLTGSGAQNRDEEIFGFKPFKVIADVLARRGIAVLRCDDRGVGGSSGSIAQSTTADFADDALAGVSVLAARKEIDAKRIGLIGHSEGTSVAAIAASRDPRVAFIALLAPPAVRGDLAMRRQTIDLMKMMGASDAQVAAIAAAHEQLTRDIAAGAADAALIGDLRTLGRAQIEAQPAARNAIGDVDAYIDRTLSAQLAQMKSPWMRDAISFDPATVLSKVHCPVLAMFGGLDTQVPIDLNRAPLAAALTAAGNHAVTIKTYPEANHLFIKAVIGSPTEYPALEKVFVPGLLDDLATWVAGVTAR
jgi:pimeloyl-ACP methyl ester carboxylesterase